MPTDQPIINAPPYEAQCPAYTRLRRGMYAFAQAEVIIYNMPRYAEKEGLPDPGELYTLQPGDRVLIDNQATYSDGASNPYCYRNSYFWHVKTAFEDPPKDLDIEGWVFEYYYFQSKDRTEMWPQGYYLGPDKP